MNITYPFLSDIIDNITKILITENVKVECATGTTTYVNEVKNPHNCHICNIRSEDHYLIVSLTTINIRDNLFLYVTNQFNKTHLYNSNNGDLLNNFILDLEDLLHIELFKFVT